MGKLLEYEPRRTILYWRIQNPARKKPKNNVLNHGVNVIEDITAAPLVLNDGDDSDDDDDAIAGLLIISTVLCDLLFPSYQVPQKT